jgi:hypothetical protein
MLCAAAAASAVAHLLIDVLGDYVLVHDTYDDVAHGSRILATALALLIAVVLAARAIRVCMQIVVANRSRAPVRSAWYGRSGGFVFAVIVSSLLIVPAMEWLDGWLAGAPVAGIGAAFGGSILLGIGSTTACAAIVASTVYALVRWLLGHREALITIVETLLRRYRKAEGRSAFDLARQRFQARRRYSPHAVRLCKRGPPPAVRSRHDRHPRIKGGPREIRFLVALACERRACDAARRFGGKGFIPIVR